MSYQELIEEARRVASDINTTWDSHKYIVDLADALEQANRAGQAEHELRASMQQAWEDAIAERDDLCSKLKESEQNELKALRAVERFGKEADALRSQLEEVKSIVSDLADTGATYVNYSDGENSECAVCGQIVDGSLYFRSWQEKEGHSPECPVERATAYLATTGKGSTA